MREKRARGREGGRERRRVWVVRGRCVCVGGSFIVKYGKKRRNEGRDPRVEEVLVVILKCGREKERERKDV